MCSSNFLLGASGNRFQVQLNSEFGSWKPSGSLKLLFGSGGLDMNVMLKATKLLKVGPERTSDQPGSSKSLKKVRYFDIY